MYVHTNGEKQKKETEDSSAGNPNAFNSYFFYASYSRKSASFHSNGTMHLDINIVLRWTREDILAYENNVQVRKGHQERSTWLPYTSVSYFLFLDYVQHAGLWEDPDDLWQLKHTSAHTSPSRMSPTAAAVLSQIREPKWKDGTDLGLEGPCNLLQPSGHYGKVTWKIKCREVS